MLADMLPPFWDELLARTEGPLHFRFILQPAVAMFLAMRDGYRDAACGRAPYLQDLLYNPAGRGERLKEGFHAVARVMVLGVVMDAAYQFLEIKAFRPMEMIMVVALLAFVPYLLMRGPARRVIHWYLARKASAQDIHARRGR
ncbi:MAG TPA: hypothetical protein VN175_02905 [Rhizomicrobium sp.]|nr:hypothetical protein [Rhizomicrobium sp.]